MDDRENHLHKNLKIMFFLKYRKYSSKCILNWGNEYSTNGYFKLLNNVIIFYTFKKTRRFLKILTLQNF